MPATTLKHTDDDGKDHFIEIDRYTGASYVIRFKDKEGAYIAIPKGWLMQGPGGVMKPLADRTLYIINTNEVQSLVTIDGHDLLFGAHLSVHSESARFVKVDDEPSLEK